MTDESAISPPLKGKKILFDFDGSFATIHQNSCALIEALPVKHLYDRPQAAAARDEAFSSFIAGEFIQPSCAESMIRSAAAVEQTCGGITANLWDDPFEWTLIETLSTAERIIEYLNEVEATRQRAFASIESDCSLTKEIATPSGETRTLFALLSDTLVRAAHHQGRAFATAQLFKNCASVAGTKL